MGAGHAPGIPCALHRARCPAEPGATWLAGTRLFDKLKQKTFLRLEACYKIGFDLIDNNSKQPDAPKRVDSGKSR
jgi:hypothetical protein